MTTERDTPNTIAADSFALAAGTLVGQYRLEKLLGTGGMGIVYRATCTKLDRPAAVKFLWQQLADAEGRRRFQLEARSASSLNHPHIVTVYDTGEFRDQQYLVTELVDGVADALATVQGGFDEQDFWLLDLATMQSRRLTQLSKTDTMRTFDITPDGREIVFDRQRQNSDLVLIDLPRA